MGDFTPEAVEVQCPGCNSFFRIRPKSERVNDATVSCPKCFADIPVESNRLPAGSTPSSDLSQAEVAFSRIETRRAAAFPPDKTPASTIRSLAARPLAPNDSNDDDDDDDQNLFTKLDRLTVGTFTEPDTIRSTFTGFPGRTSENPFQRSESTTSSSRSPLLQEFADLDEQEKSSLDDVHSEATKERKTPNIYPPKDRPTIPAISHNNKETQETKEEKTSKDEHLRETSELTTVTAAMLVASSRSSKKRPQQPTDPQPALPPEAKKAQIISKLKARIPSADTEQPTTPSTPPKDTENLSEDSYNDAPDGTTGILKPESIPEEYREWTDFPSDEASSLTAGSTLDIAIQNRSSSDSLNTDSSEPDAEPSLAKLFKRAQKRRATLPGDILPSKPEPARATTISKSEPAISVDITEDEVATILDTSTELSQSRINLFANTRPTIPALQKSEPRPTPPVLPTPPASKISSPKTTPKPPSLKDKLLVTENSGIHDGLFAGITPPTEKPPHPITHDSITVRPDRSGKTTSQSMLARLRQRRESMEIDAATASESRGSGFIRLPTAEIQQVLGRGSYRLLIENIVYEPVDKDGLIQLIKGGVLLGAEEIAEADGDWMPVSQHPVFEELRRRLAAEAHLLLSRISNAREAEKADRNLPQPPTTPTSSDVLISQPVIIVDDTPAEPEPTSLDPISEPLLASPVEPNFALLSDSEANEVPRPQDQPTEDPISEPIEDPSPHNLFDEPINEPINEPAEKPAKDTKEKANETTDDFPESYTEDANWPEQQEAAPRKSKKLLLLLLLIVAGAAVYAFSQSGNSTTPTPAPNLAVAPATAQPEEKTENLEEKPDEIANLQEKPDIQPETQPNPPSNTDDPFVRWQNSAKDPAESLAIARELLTQQNFRNARTIAAHGMATSDAPDDFQAIFQESIQADADLQKSEALNAVALFNINGIRIHDSQQQPHIILTRDGADRFIFKPAKTNQTDTWRSEIAAYRLCEMILCSFEIPHTAPAKILRADWERIAPDSDLTAQMLWQSSSPDDTDASTQFVHGALQELVPQTTPWPIEITGLWRDWLGTAPTFNALSQDFTEAHTRLTNFGDGTMYQAILEQQANITTHQLAEQLSTLILFDFLTNNWERFSNNTDLYGLGTPFANGKIISYDNGQTFQSRASRRVLGRFEWTGRFSRSTLAAVRALTPDLANAVLFEQPSALERTRLDVFWNQHRQALSRIDASIERHGTELVFPFD